MLRRTLYLAVLALVGATGWASSSYSARVADAGKPQTSSAPFVHVVIMTLKRSAPEKEVDALIADAHEMLQSIPTVRDLRAGRPDDKATSNLVRKDYSVALMLLFDDHEGLQTYTNHPNHLNYVKKHMQYLDTSKLLVYDFMNQKQ